MWVLVTHLSGQIFGRIHEGKVVQECCLTLEYGTNSLSRNVVKLPTHAA